MQSNGQSSTEHSALAQFDNQKYREAIAAGIPSLTKTELSIAVLLVLNCDSKQIGSKLKMDVRSIDNHRSHIRRKLRLHRGESLEVCLLKLVHSFQTKEL